MVFSSCHDDSLTSRVSEKKPEDVLPSTKKIEEKTSDNPSDSDDTALITRVSIYGSQLEGLMRKDPALRRIIEILESTER
ncbi:hypothetical protein BLBBOR_p002 (plasmid) [Blattabacterium sp. (Blatta orientalis) str. Tarazona]|nr:hypothetical protein BLBBOR_p002 [Blattabacterium sp. (Blatta orientalis) str. Tarazona]